MSVAEIIEATVQEVGARKVIVSGTKTARVDYVLQLRNGKQGELLDLSSVWRSVLDPRRNRS